MTRTFFKLKIFILSSILLAVTGAFAASAPRAPKAEPPSNWGTGVEVEPPKAVACQIDLSSVDAIVGLKTRAIRKLFENGRSTPEFRVAIRTLFPELGAEVENFYSPELDARLHLEDKTLLEDEGVSVLCLDNKPRVIIKWKNNDIYGLAAYQAYPASVNAATALHEFRATLNQRLGRRDPWLVPTALTGIEFLQNDELILDPRSATGVDKSHLTKLVEITIGGTHGELGRLRVSKNPNGDWLVFSSRLDQERGLRKVFRWPAGEGAKIVPHAMLFFRSLSTSKLFKEHTVITVASGEGQTPPAHYGVLADPDGFDHLIEMQLRGKLAHAE